MTKRLFDLAALALFAPLWLPLLVLVAASVRVFIGAPVLFVQERTGLGGRTFKLLKFRSMTQARDASGRLLPDEKRMTGFSRLLRSTSLDELPELLNVLTGEMSLVGPRPLLPEYLPLYDRNQFRRHEVKPGITGWAQVNGRNAISWERKFSCDVWYVEHCSVWLDIRILGRTIMKVLSGEGISQEGHVTAEPFRGGSQ